MARFDYRQFYKDYYGISFDNEFDVHHIDGDRSNNSIENLILLPSSLHSAYHMCRPSGVETQIDMSNQSTHQYQMLLRFCETMIEIQAWKNYKMSLDMERVNK